MEVKVEEILHPNIKKEKEKKETNITTTLVQFQRTLIYDQETKLFLIHEEHVN